MAKSILDFVTDGLNRHRETPGWLTIADETGINYSTLWRIADGQGDTSKLSTLNSIADWLHKNA